MNEAFLSASKRILILTADAGFGHRAAAEAVAQASSERHGDACTVDIVNPLDDRRAPARWNGNPQAAFRVAELAWQAALRGPLRRKHRLVAHSPLLRNLRSSFGLGLEGEGERLW